ncbi:MAG: hypothetical protein NZO58_14515 [Gemmataceae bacterium]|nr:hypothetical protein [Gemmataceae bacterium]
MEILEVVVALMNGCGCFLEMVAGVANFFAGWTGYRLRRELREHRDASEHGEAAPAQPRVWPFVLLVFSAVFLTGLVAFKWLR